MVATTKTVHPSKKSGDQQQRHTQRKEKLCHYKETWQKKIENDEIFFLENPPATSKNVVVEMLKISEVAKADLPQTCKKIKP